MCRLVKLSRRGLALGAVLTALLVFAGVTPTGAASKLEILFPTPPTTYGIPYYIAHDKGWFKGMDLELEDKHLLGDASAFRALVAGDGDVVLIGPSTTMGGILAGAKVKVIGSWQPRVDYQVVANPKKANKIADLVGLKMAGGGGISMLNHMTTMIMKKHNLDPKTTKFVPVGGHSARLAAVVAGKADFSLVNTLTATKAGTNINWITPVAGELGGLGYVYLAVKEKDLKDSAKREAFRKFMKGSIMGARHAVAHPGDAAKSLNKRIPEMPVDLILAVVKKLNAIPVWGINGGIPNEVTDFTAKAYLEYGVIKKAVSPAQVLDRSIVDPLIKELGMYKG